MKRQKGKPFKFMNEEWGLIYYWSIKYWKTTCKKGNGTNRLFRPNNPPPLYAFYPQKKHSHLHTMAFSSWFSGGSSVKALFFKYSPHRRLTPSFFCWFSGTFPVWRLAPSTLHRRSPSVWMLYCPCECFTIQAFTLKTPENQQETDSMWMGECFLGK